MKAFIFNNSLFYFPNLFSIFYIIYFLNILYVYNTYVFISVLNPTPYLFFHTWEHMELSFRYKYFNFKPTG